MLKRTAVAGAVVWAAPIVTAGPAYAAGSLSTNLCDCGNGTKGTVTSVTYRYEGGDCSFSLCGPSTGNNAARCFGGPLNPLDPGEVYEVDVYQLTGNVSQGCKDPATITAAPDYSTTVTAGGTFTYSFTGNGPNLQVVITDPEGNKQSICYHFSCSQPLCFEDKHGPLYVDSYTVSC